ncbi:hypothetical protein E2C01_062867 [Portunus trituberculatus]|uniref:C2H2-type domain-containing protein n=1 Tax=Portunus trituberculatus TaxID=210409 RepID=A0A5B7HEX5_PORTR|nr:hypothetical protein [Portunus trituberculatus]
MLTVPCGLVSSHTLDTHSLPASTVSVHVSVQAARHLGPVLHPSPHSPQCGSGCGKRYGPKGGLATHRLARAGVAAVVQRCGGAAQCGGPYPQQLSAKLGHHYSLHYCGMY